MYKRSGGFRVAVYQLSAIKRNFRLVTVACCSIMFLLSLTALNSGTFSRNVGGERRMYPVKDRLIKADSLLRVSGMHLDSRKGFTDLGHYDILVNSYQRSGSSFTGQLLAYQPDTFYWYEPIWHVHGLSYFMGRYVCLGNNKCGDFGNKHRDAVHEILQNIYSCNFTDLAPVVTENMTVVFSGAVWKPYLSCEAQGQPKTVCLKIMEDVCKLSKRRATKIVRLTVDNLEYILERNSNLKAIHLIRDPRAIINSQITTKWYEMSDSAKNDHQLIGEKAKDLCFRMKYDLIKGEKLKQKYPGRFSFIMYEDLQDDLKSNTEMLYSYFGIDKTTVEEKVTNIPGILQEDHKVKRKQGDYTNWWRFQFDFSAVKVIDEACGDVLTFLGYEIFTNEVELKNISHKAYSLRKELLISHMNQTGIYDFTTLHKQRPYIRNIDIIPKHGTKMTEKITVIV